MGNISRWMPALIIVLLAAAVGGCTPAAKIGLGDNPLDGIRKGMAEGEMVQAAGVPDFIDLADPRFYVYYYKEKILSDCEKTPGECFPVVVKSGRVVAVGQKEARGWKNRVAAAAKPKDDSPPAAGREAETPPAESREAEITRLDRQVRKIPMAKTMENLTIYRRLLKLDPENRRYRRKVAFYQERLEEEKAGKDAMRKAQNQALENLEGNESVRMALKILGAGKFHIWIQNDGSAPFAVNSGQFSLLCRDGKRFTPYRSRDFGITLAPGQKADGRISFETYCSPREVAFTSPVTGRISRIVPRVNP